MRGSGQRWLMLVVVLAGSALAPPAAATEGACTAPGTHPTIQAAIDDPSCDLIRLEARTYQENLTIGRSVEIDGAGTTRTILDGAAGRVVAIDDASPDTVALRDLTITGGVAPGASSGGGVLVMGSAHLLSLFDVAVVGNSATGDGGGIWVEFGSLSMVGGSISGNTAAGSNGGGMATDMVPTSTARLVDVSISGNQASTGGGVYLSGGSVDLVGVTIDGNTAPEIGGGLIAASPISIRDTAITNNAASGAPTGGLHVEGTSGASTPIDLVNVTVSGNRSTEGTGGLYFGTGAKRFINVTVTNNVADSDAGGDPGDTGGIFTFGSPDVANSILSGNVDGTPSGDDADLAGTYDSLGHNIVGSTGGATWNTGPGDVFGVDPRLGPLADNGGATLTHALLKGSPAINQADVSSSPQTDQRGLQRKDPDIGAYELVYCLKVPVNRIGTNGKDKLKGTNGPDGMLGMGGKDTLSGKGGKDGLCGGGGKDTLKGGGGKDRMKGQGGKDRCIGGGGNDVAVCEEERTV